MPSVKTLKLVAASVFVVWHTLAIVLAPAPASAAVLALYRFTRPYVHFFNLNNQWKYFVRIGYGGNVDYAVDGAEGEKARFTMPPQYDHRNLAYFQYFHIQNELFGGNPPQDLLKDLAHYYCRKHAVLNPRRVEFILRIQKEIKPDDFAKGFSPSDATFVREATLAPVECAE